MRTGATIKYEGRLAPTGAAASALATQPVASSGPSAAVTNFHDAGQRPGAWKTSTLTTW